MSLLPLLSDAGPFLCLAAFQSAIVFGVAIIDASNAATIGASASNAIYAAVVQALASLVYLVVRLVSRARERAALALASRDPLGSILPPARSASTAAWRSLVEASRTEAARLLAESAAAAKEDLDSFVMAVHAIKTPAAAVGLMADRAERTGEAIRPLDLRLESEELERLLELALGRIRLGDFERDAMVERIDLRELISSSVRRTRRIFIARGISVAISDGPVLAETDRKWMLFILDQVIVNAAKYARSAVRVDAARTDEVATVFIEDDGNGIPVEDRDRLFARSFVGATGRHADLAGTPSTGYGLHLAARAAEKLGVGIAVNPAPGGGTRATISVPVARDRFA